MDNTLLLVWVAIAIIGIIAIIIVKLYFGDKKEKEEDLSNITTRNPLQEMISESDNNQVPQSPVDNVLDYYEYEEEPSVSFNRYEEEPVISIENNEENPYIISDNQNAIPNRNISYSSQNQVLINYDDNVKKFQEPITQTQRDIMSQNDNKEKNSDVSFRKTTENKHELKDLFTIDELIKESKRKDDEREKESKTIKKDEVDNSDIKESIRKNQEAKKLENEEDTDLADIKNSIEKMHKIAEAIKSNNDENEPSSPVASQKDISEAIDSATKEDEEKEEVPEISQTNSITDAVIKKDEISQSNSITDAVNKETQDEETTIQETLTPLKEEKSETEIKTAPLKTPNKIEEDSISVLPGADEDYEFGASIDSSNLFEDENGELSDLDYRKDLNKVKNTFKNSSIVQEIRGRLAPEPEENEDVNEEFIRNVNSYAHDEYEEPYYDEYEPIINETHVDYIEPTPEEQLRQDNTRRVFENAKNNSSKQETEENEELIPTPKSKPERSSLKITINTNEEVLRKGDEIIFNHEGETYSSKVYAINGDDIKVKYRRQDITIKASDIKKIY